MHKFTDEELQAARSVDLVDFAAHMNIPLKRKGRYYYVDGMDSLVIFNRSTWYRYSRGIGGSAIDFLMYFENLTFREAVSRLLEFAGYMTTGDRGTAIKPTDRIKVNKGFPKDRFPQDIRESFILPEKAPDCRRLYAYLMKRRMLSKEVVRYWLEKMLYESLPYHNIVFLGRDQSGTVRFASQRGTRDPYGEPFKGDVPGNDKRYGVNLVPPGCSVLNVYEAAIDAMSDMDFREDYETGILALGMVSDGPLQTILKENPYIKTVSFCLDNDLPGRRAAKKLAEKYKQAGYEVTVRFPPYGKDYNEFLQVEREKQNRLVQPQRHAAR